MASVWYTGDADSYTVEVLDWAANGITANRVVWNEQNGYSVPVAGFSPHQLTILATQGRFVTNAPDGPRDPLVPLPPPLPPPAVNPPPLNPLVRFNEVFDEEGDFLTTKLPSSSGLSLDGYATIDYVDQQDLHETMPNLTLIFENGLAG